MPKIPKGVTLQIQKQVSSIENLKNRSSEPVFKRKQAGTGPNRRHIQGSTSCEVWGKIDNAVREKKTSYPNFETLYRS